MSQGATIALALAQKIAEKIREELAPYCDKIDIAGSVRRLRPFCSDVDLVLLTREGMRRELERRVQQNPSTRVLKNGAQIMALMLSNGVQVDLYFAQPEQNDLAGYVPGNYGMRLLAMTGSREHNVWLAQEAKRRGLHFAPYRGLMRGGRYRIANEGGEEYHGGEVWRGESELEILRELGLGWIPPEQREIQNVDKHPREEPS